MTGGAGRARQARPGSPRRRATIALAFGVVLLCGVVAVQRAPALDTPSLFFDDQWVGLIVHDMSFAQYVALAPPVAPLFVLAEKAVVQLVPGRTASLLLLPAAISVLVLAGVPALGRRAGLTTAWCFALTAALAVNPVLAEFGPRAKGFSVDVAVTLLLLVVGLPLLRHPEPRRLLALAGAGLAAALLSFTAVFVVAPLVNLAAARGLVAARGRASEAPVRAEGARAARRCLLVALAFDLALLLLYALVLRRFSREGLVAFWSDAFVGGAGPGAAATALASSLGAMVSGALPPGLGWLGWILVPGLLVGLWDRRWRWPCAFFCAYLAARVVASGARIYPLGAPRLELFGHPLILAAMATSAVVLARRARAWLRPERARRRALRFASAALAVGCGLVATASCPRSRYHPSPHDGLVEDALLVQAAAELEAPLILYSGAHLAAAYYGPWPVTFVPQGEEAILSFKPLIQRPDTLQAVGGGSPEGLEVLRQQVARFVADRPARVVFLATLLPPEDEAERTVRATLRAAGYRQAGIRRATMGLVALFEREPAGH